MGAFAEPIYIICAPFTPLEESERFLNLQEAITEGIKISRYARGIQIQVRLFESEDVFGELMAACENGQVLQAVQASLFTTVNSRIEQKIQSDTGRVWWKLLENWTEEITSFRSRLTPKTPEEEEAIKKRENMRDQLLARLKKAMKEEAFLAAKWKFIDRAEYSNREVERPIEIRYKSMSSVRKAYGQAFIQTGRIAIQERWMMTSDVRVLFEQLLGAYLEPKESEVTAKPELSVVSRRKRLKQVTFESVSEFQQTTLFV